PVRRRAFLKSFLIWAASAGVASMGIRSLSWKLTPNTPPTSPKSSTIFAGSSLARVGSPNGSRPGLPTVQRPKVNLSAGVGVSASVLAIVIFLAVERHQRGDRGRQCRARQCRVSMMENQMIRITRDGTPRVQRQSLILLAQPDFL